jgi:hypothetical protein
MMNLHSSMGSDYATHLLRKEVKMMKRIVLLIALIVSLIYFVPVLADAYGRHIEFMQMQELQRQLEEAQRRIEEAERAKQLAIRNSVRAVMDMYGCADEEILEIIMEQQEVMDPVVVAIVIGIESGFNRHAYNSRSKCAGLMQIHPVHRLKNPYDPRENISFGTRFLSYLYKKFGSLELALAAFNAGPGTVARCGGVPDFTETKNYIKKFNRIYEEVSLYV